MLLFVILLCFPKDEYCIITCDVYMFMRLACSFSVFSVVGTVVVG